MTLRRRGRDDDARKLLGPIVERMDVIESGAYHRLLLMYKGLITAEALLAETQAGLDAVTVQYGVAAWHLYNGRADRAGELFREIVAGDQRAAFGYIAAEADLKRLRR